MTKKIKVITNKEAGFKIHELVSKYTTNGLLSKPMVRIHPNKQGKIEIDFACSVTKVSKFRRELHALTNEGFEGRIRIGA